MTRLTDEQWREYMARNTRWQHGMEYVNTDQRAGRMLGDGYTKPVVVRTQPSPPLQEQPLRRAAKVDANQPEIVEALRKAGARVAITSAVGEGFPDLVVGYRGHVYPIEIKDGALPLSARRLTPEQVRFHREWAGHCWLANNVDEALQIIGAVGPGPRAA